MKHITSACPILAKEKYIKRHDRVCAQLHFNIMQGNRGKITQQTSACPILTKEKYIKRHDRVCAVLHFKIMQGNRGKITQRTLA